MIPKIMRGNNGKKTNQTSRKNKANQSLFFTSEGGGSMSTDGSPERSETDGRSRGSQSGRGIKFPSTGGDGAEEGMGVRWSSTALRLAPTAPKQGSMLEGAQTACDGVDGLARPGPRGVV